MSEPFAIIGKEFPSFVIPYINQASHSIRLAVFEWIFTIDSVKAPLSDFNRSLVDASKRGVDVRVLVSSRDLAKLLKAHGLNSRFFGSKGLFHMKLIIIDDRIVVLGSHNFTFSAFNSNHECSACFRLETGDNRFCEYFDNLYNLYGV